MGGADVADEQESRPADGVVRQYREARGHLDSGRFAEATRAFAWLWENMLRAAPAMVGVRGSYMVGEIARLVVAYPPAREVFQRIRDETASQLQDPGADRIEARRDWVKLTLALGEEDRVIEWFEAAAEMPEARGELEGSELDLSQALIRRGRWADLVRLCNDPVARLSLHRTFLARLRSSSLAPGEIEDDEWAQRWMYGRWYAGLLAAGSPEADTFASRWRETFQNQNPRTILDLLRWALQAGEARPIHREWLDDPAVAWLPEATELRKTLDAALGDVASGE